MQWKKFTRTFVLFLILLGTPVMVMARSSSVSTATPITSDSSNADFTDSISKDNSYTNLFSFRSVIYEASIIATSTMITVTSTADDYTDGFSVKCSDAAPCTLRRALNQARGLTSGDRPVAIVFDIPVSDSGYNAALGVWKISLNGSSAYDLREVYGQTIIDGTTQPGGRSSGQKIIVDGLGNHNNGFILRQNDNIVRGLAMQNFKNTHITISSDNNTIENCWFGLSDDGVTLSSGSDTNPEGGSGVSFSAGSDGNIVQDNIFTGFFGVAAAIRGSNNVFAGNWIGIRGDGTVPIPVQFDQHPCQSGAWTGGSGITVADNNNQIGGPNNSDGNTFAGLFLDVGPTTTQRPAMDVIGSGHNIQNNVIGVTPNQDIVGVCGRGLDFGGGPHDIEVEDNTIVETALSAILMNGTLVNGITLQGNVIQRDNQWPGAQPPNNFSENAIAYGPTVPAALRDFVPAKIISVNGTTATGVSGPGSPCPFCLIELFLDDNDSVTEALNSLQVVTASSSGTWQAILPAELQTGQGIRTMSTVPDDFTITGLDRGTTSNLSALQGYAYVIYLPSVLRK